MEFDKPLLRRLIEEQIPDGRSKLEESHTNLERVAAYCEANYLQSENKKVAFEETKSFAIKSLGSVAYHINNLAVNILQTLNLQNERIDELQLEVSKANHLMKMRKEKCGRRQIGMLAVPKKSSNDIKTEIIQRKPAPHYERKPIDYSSLDDIGHGTIIPDYHAPQNIMSGNIYASTGERVMSQIGTIARAPSSISTTYASTTDLQHKRSIGTLSRSGVRSTVNEGHYRVPQIAPTPKIDPELYSTLTRAQASQMRQHYNNSHEQESQSTLLGGTIYAQAKYSQNYDDRNVYGGYNTGTLRSTAPHFSGVNQYVPISGMNTINNTNMMTGTLTRKSSNPNDYSSLSNNMANLRYIGQQPISSIPPIDDDDGLPNPPQLFNSQFYNNIQSSIGSNDFNHITSINQHSNEISSINEPSWAPVTYIEKGVVIYDYDADKPDELTLREGNIVYILRKNDDGWNEGVMDGTTGLFPGNYVKPIV
ncbi:Abelson interacting protein [Strongyloides ratti]|uniref:Abelson interacting protein n=1 Tax=Strongyloides ratti TaxID=34506 RepID=A0A090L6G1_STRRB|nr:Abelson interacting protein [Strongyloides ratti]CEF65391.1 Abelson interacting protein [Strongyloides ratti]